jgi:cytochrome c oxidase subunit 2
VNGTPIGLLAPAASDSAARVDLLFGVVATVCALVALTLAVLVVTFAVRYRRGARIDRSHAPAVAPRLEWGWTLGTLAVFLGLFAWSASAYVALVRTPADALPVYVVAKQWMWKLQHRGGRREINELHLPLGAPVRLVMTSQDVIHSFYVPAFRIKQDVVPGRYTTMSFTPTRVGDFRLFCAEYCGSEHSVMVGRVVVMPPADFARWLDAGPAEPGLAQRGFALYRQHGCSGCHDPSSTVRAPPLEGLIGRVVHLQDGRTLVADENYVRDSILEPRKDVVAGHAPVMPSFAGQLDEEDIAALVAWMRPAATEGTR